MGGQRHPDGVATIQATTDDMASFRRASEDLSSFAAPVLLKRESPTDRLFLAAFDGTGNSMLKDAPENHTNVAQIYRQVHDLRRQGIDNIRAGYVEGVGTQGGLAGTRDLISGHTYTARLEEMYLQFATEAKRWLEENPDADIRLASIGFSRGAEQAAGFTRLVEERGIQDPEGAKVVRGRDGLIDRVEFTKPPLREPGTVVQAIGLFDPVGTGVPRDHDRRPAASVVSGFQITAADERRNLFQGTRITDMGTTYDGRFLNVLVAGAHSDIGGGYELNGLSIRSGNLMIDYLNALSDQPFLVKRAEPVDPALNVIHRSEQHQVFYRTSEFDRNGTRVHQEELAPPPLCRIDCRDAEPRNDVLAAGLAWQPVAIAPVPGRTQASPETQVADRAMFVERLLGSAHRDDGRSTGQLSQEHLQGDAGQAWLRHGQAQLQASGPVREAAPARMHEATELMP